MKRYHRNKTMKHNKNANIEIDQFKNEKSKPGKMPGEEFKLNKNSKPMNEKPVSRRQERERFTDSKKSAHEPKERSDERKPSKPNDFTAWMHSLHYTGRTTATFCH